LFLFFWNKINAPKANACLRSQDVDDRSIKENELYYYGNDGGGGGGRGERGAKCQTFSDADNSFEGVMRRAFFNTAQFTNVTFAFARHEVILSSVMGESREKY
jgi:hypothetical protein